jgi:hypothetical protein
VSQSGGGAASYFVVAGTSLSIVCVEWLHSTLGHERIAVQVALAWPDQIESRSCQWLRLRHRAKQKWPWPANFQQPVVRADGQRWSLVGKWRAAKFTGNEQRPPSKQASEARHLTAETFSPRCCCCCKKEAKMRGCIGYSKDPRKQNNTKNRLPNLPLQRERCTIILLVLPDYSPPPSFPAVRAAQKIVGEQLENLALAPPKQ